MASSIDAFFRELQFGKLEKNVKVHLQNVYTTMGVALLACALGGYIHLFTSILSMNTLTLLGELGVLMLLVFTPPTRDNLTMRVGILMVFSFLTGINLGPILDHTMHIDPSIIATAFLASSLIFICFSVSALLSNDRKWLAFGGILMSCMSWLLLLGVLNIFFGSVLLFKIQVYLGLVVMCGFVLYDTQLIVEKRRSGDDDYVMHCMKLFLDFINIFRYLLIILSDKDGKKDKRRRD